MEPKKNKKNLKKTKSQQTTPNPKKLQLNIKMSHIFGWFLIILLCVVPLAPLVQFLYDLCKSK
ncbi:hypothetical protein [Candidatus Phytoplasma solani]|uniref:hypothetical protein n=1 Tax=Candidatus Phytoplasma solani TaxID=69896 RepID=UPI0003B7D4CA|nr:hypothetical protein [Candidatus Phytoplasma solani]CCP88344.1 hypothetical protein S284_04070 [Candidatus Phytoplasma solani]CCP88713.1 hypothetical protein S231_02560 [Candidatus Phytoplasma solani]